MDPAPDARSYVICSTPRSGSTLLARALLSTGQLGVPAEYFNRTAHLPEYIERFATSDLSDVIAAIRRVRTSPNGVFGFKAHFAQYVSVVRDVPMGKIFPTLKFIFITRNDLLRQSISYVRALQTKAWTADRPTIREPRFDFFLLIEAMNFILASNANWERLFAALGISPLRITYEGMCAAPSDVVGSVFELLGLATKPCISLDDLALRMQRDEVTEEWVGRFRDEFPDLNGSAPMQKDALDALELAPVKWRAFRRERMGAASPTRSRPINQKPQT